MIEKEVLTLSRALEDAIKEILTLRSQIEIITKVLHTHKEWMDKNTVVRTADTKALVGLIARVARSSSDPTLADDLNKMLDAAANPQKPAEEVIPELLN